MPTNCKFKLKSLDIQMFLKFRAQATVLFMQLCDSSTGRLFRPGFWIEREKYGKKAQKVVAAVLQDAERVTHCN
jgi:hypothetical protein